jgi:putative transposase
MTRLDPELRTAAVALLRAQRLTGQFGVTERTVWRWLTAPTDPPRRRRSNRYQITEADRDACADKRRNVAAVHRELRAGCSGGPSLRRWQLSRRLQLARGRARGADRSAL